MNELDKLAIKYGADKWGKHHYTPVYYEMFKNRRLGSDINPVENVLEIGVAEGASLRMWKEFFPKAHVYGADNDFYRIFKEERITVFQCDQSSAGDLERLMIETPALDLVVDDGSHKPKDQVDTCLKLMSLLNLDVTYVIEDAADPSIVTKLYNYDVQIIECGKRYDDRLIIVKHKNG